MLQELAKERGKQVSTHLFGQEINAETYAICKADLLLKGEGEAADNIVGGPEHSTLSNDAFPTREFDFMLSNPPYGKSWKTDLQRMGGKKDMHDHRFVIEHAGDPEYSLVTRSSDGQLLFLVNKLSKMKQETRLGSRIAEVHNGSSLFTGSAGQGESNIRRWIIENDWLEAIVALPLNMFYNTGIATYVWVLTNRKPEHRKGKVQLIDATKWFRPLRKNLGKKNCELGPEDIERICQAFLDFQESEESKIFDNEAFGYWKVTVERPLRLKVDLSEERLDEFFKACLDARDVALGDAVDEVGHELGPGPHLDFNRFLEEMKAVLPQHGIKLTAKRKKLLQTILTERDETAQPVIKRWHRLGTAPDPIQGLNEYDDGIQVDVVEYVPDPELRDTEQIPLQEPGGIEGFLRREVLPYAKDAWYVPKSVKIGYEISFNRYFYKPEPMRTLEEIRADILAGGKEDRGVVIGGYRGWPSLSKIPSFQPSIIESLAKVLGECGSGSDISRVLTNLGIHDGSGQSTKWRRLNWIFLNIQQRDRCANKILAFIQSLLAPARFVGRNAEFELHRSKLNIVLAFSGLEYGVDGNFRKRPAAATITEAEKRANTIQAKFQGRRIHSEVLKYCKAELMQDNYFHAVFEASKGLAQRIRNLSGVDGDGANLVDRVFSVNEPILAFNTLQTETEMSEHKGFAALLKGCFAAVRNPLAHKPKIM